MSRLITIERHLMGLPEDMLASSGDITRILYDISVAAKMIRRQVVVAGFETEREAGITNVHGEDVATLDVFANTCIKEILSSHGRFSYLGSEEEEEIITVDTAKTDGYAIFFDPLDGSSNIDVNVSVGTIFSIYKTDETWKSSKVRPGAEQVASGYVIYGSSVMMVYTMGNGVHGFTYDPSIGEFLLSHYDIKIPDKPKYYSMNESLYPRLDADARNIWANFKKENEDLSLRYVGSLVADFHRNLIKGGVFIYSGD
jgi:Fructose-1,6-bisphosphatase